MEQYCKRIKIPSFPRLPLEGQIDLTYRCNNDCRHCWLRLPLDAAEKGGELAFDEIKWIIEEAQNLGCREWAISGGEPMIRKDFTEIFDLITRKSRSYTLNTNGTCITPNIAQLMKRDGVNLIAIYGASAEVHDDMTRNPGSFEAAMRGIAYLREAGAQFIVQIVPMKGNFHQYQDMIQLALSLSPRWRVGAAWLYLSAAGDAERNREIRNQRLSPEDVVKIDPPTMGVEDGTGDRDEPACRWENGHDGLFASCIAHRNNFHIDPYGRMSFCEFIKDPSFRYDLRGRSFSEGWDGFIPDLAQSVRRNEEYDENCGTCALRPDCRWCASYAYLEERRYSAKVGYLCAVARENRRFKNNWIKDHRRYYRLAGMTIQVDADLPISDTTFLPVFKQFEIAAPGEDVISIRHHFALPDIRGRDLGTKVFQRPPWIIYRKGQSWIYVTNPSPENENQVERVAMVNHDHSRARIFHYSELNFRRGRINSLALFPSDQILLARALAEREACYMHASGVAYEKKGLLFVGHSEAGKSTIAKMFEGRGKLLCDDRIVVRKWPAGYRIHGTWSRGEIPSVSSDDAPLSGIFFLEKSDRNVLARLDDKRLIVKRLLACLIKPLATADWWDKMFTLLEAMAADVPCYVLRFDRSGKAVELFKSL